MEAEKTTHAEKVELIQKWLDSGEVIPAHDVSWLLDTMKAYEAKLAEVEKSVSDLKTSAARVVASNTLLRHNLTLWLAVRGSNTEEFFIATKQLASQTAKCLNE